MPDKLRDVDDFFMEYRGDPSKHREHDVMIGPDQVEDVKAMIRIALRWVLPDSEDGVVLAFGAYHSIESAEQNLDSLKAFMVTSGKGPKVIVNHKHTTVPQKMGGFRAFPPEVDNVMKRVRKLIPAFKKALDRLANWDEIKDHIDHMPSGNEAEVLLTLPKSEFPVYTNRGDSGRCSTMNDMLFHYLSTDLGDFFKNKTGHHGKDIRVYPRINGENIDFRVMKLPSH